jgi:hypothetical protein
MPRIKYGIPDGVLVDDDIKEFLCIELKTFGWCISNGYCVRSNTASRKTITIKLHRLIAALYFGIDAIKDKEIDHINGNKIDNRKCNLRICSHSENCRNRAKYISNTSGFKGVTWFKRDSNWRVRITVNGDEKLVGYFDDKLEAAREYDKASKYYHKEFAHLNFKETI